MFYLKTFKTDKKVYMLDHFIFLVRRLILVLVLIFKWRKGQQQTLCIFISWVIVLIWKLIIRPFKLAIMNIQDALFESFLSTIILVYFKFTNESTELLSSGNPHRLGVVWVTLVVLMILINFIVTLYIWLQSWKVKRLFKIGKISFQRIFI